MLGVGMGVGMGVFGFGFLEGLLCVLQPCEDSGTQEEEDDKEEDGRGRERRSFEPSSNDTTHTTPTNALSQHTRTARDDKGEYVSV